MSQVGRNDLCPCGSGLKYKKCCQSKQQSSTTANIPWQSTHARQWIDVDQKLSKELMRELQRHPAETRASCERMGFPDGGPDDEMLFGFLLNWIAHHLPIGGRTIAQTYYDSAKMSAAMHQLLECQFASHFTLFQVVEIEPGRGVLLNDVLFGEERFVWDVGLSQCVHPQAGLLGWTVSIDQVTFVGGLHPNMLPPNLFHEVWEELKQRKRLSRKDLQGVKGEILIHLWHEVLANWMNRPPPQLCNMDGDPLLWVEDGFAFPPSRRSEVWEAILALPGAQAHDADTIGFSEDRPDSAMATISVGTARMESASLVLETNSVKRGNRLRKSVEGACAGLELVKKRRKTKAIEPPSTSSPRPPRQPVDEELMKLPEVQAKIQEIRQKMNERWLDLKNPQLDGHSPRELAKTGAGRARLQKMMEEFEYRGDPPEEIKWLKAQLGLL